MTTTTDATTTTETTTEEGGSPGFGVLAAVGGLGVGAARFLRGDAGDDA